MQYVTKGELDRAREWIKREEQTATRKAPALNKEKDAVWNAAADQVGNSLGGVMLQTIGSNWHKDVSVFCKLQMMQVTSSPSMKGAGIKKDF